MPSYGFLRVACVSPRIKVANPVYNTGQMFNFVSGFADDVDLVLFPELCVTGYTCGDLFQSRDLLIETEKSVQEFLKNMSGLKHCPTVIFGCPVPSGNSLYNCAIIAKGQTISGIVPKQHLPNYKEFYEGRWFAYPRNLSDKDFNSISYADQFSKFTTNSIFDLEGVKVAIEICEDVWVPIPPSCYAAQNGATVLCNLSASNELVTKSEYRKSLVLNQSARCIAAYLYASAGPSESTADLVFGGHCLIAENGTLLAESGRAGAGFISSPMFNTIRTEIDIEKLIIDRRRTNTFSENHSGRQMDVIKVYHYNSNPVKPLQKLSRKVSANPFIPSDAATLYKRCSEIVGIQAAGLAHRLEVANIKKVVIGVSGGLDSTLALLVTCMAADAIGMPRESIHGYTLPGFGSTSRTKTNAKTLMTELNVTQHEVDIKAVCMQTFRDMGHRPFGFVLPDTVEELQEKLSALGSDATDLVFENVQARARTNLLMNSGFVVGTGDMSELALGWCTYNGDHMSMYNPNCSIPKTLVRFLVSYIADNLSMLNHKVPNRQPKLQAVLKDIYATPISPELLPSAQDKDSTHRTEDLIGPYELHDFFLFHRVRNGFSKYKTLFLVENSPLIEKYTKEDVHKWYDQFIKRFFREQFKRDCVPNGPKVGSISLSPRGDWRMPSDAEALS